MKEKKYTFFESYHRALSRVSDARYGRVVRAMSNYVFEGQEPDFADDGDWIVWELVKPILEHGAEITKIRQEAGANGGRSGKGVSRNQGNKNASKTIANNSKQKQNNSGIGVGEGIGEEIKEKDKKENVSFSLSLDERKEAFKDDISQYADNYTPDMLNAFFQHWTQLNKKGEKMKFEGQKYWNTKTRLTEWKNRKF